MVSAKRLDRIPPWRQRKRRDNDIVIFHYPSGIISVLQDDIF